MSETCQEHDGDYVNLLRVTLRVPFATAKFSTKLEITAFRTSGNPWKRNWKRGKDSGKISHCRVGPSDGKSIAFNPTKVLLHILSKAASHQTVG